MEHTIKAVIELSDNGYGVYPIGENVADLGAFGSGATLEEAKASFERACDLIKEAARCGDVDLPKVLSGEYTIEYCIKVDNFLEVFSPILPKSGISRMTGIHSKQLWAYQHGDVTPRQTQVDKIQEAMHRFAHELLSLSLLS